MQILAVTGGRVSEICRMPASALDPAGGTVELFGKTGARLFPLREPAPALFQVLEQRAEGRRPSARLLGLGPNPEETVRASLRLACERAGVPRFTPHGIRRGVVDRLIDRGVDLKVAASLTGHSVEVMLRFYRSATQEARVQAIQDAGLAEIFQK